VGLARVALPCLQATKPSRRFRPGVVAAARCYRIPAVTAAQMREVDRAMVEEFHIELVQMMENAGRSLADLAQQLFGPVGVTVLAGGGGNGGGGLVAARHLANRGISVTVTLARAETELAPSRCISATSSAGWGYRSPANRRRRTW